MSALPIEKGPKDERTMRSEAQGPQQVNKNKRNRKRVCKHLGSFVSQHRSENLQVVPTTAVRIPPSIFAPKPEMVEVTISFHISLFLSFSLCACGCTPGNFQARFQLARYTRFDLFLSLFFSSTFLFLLLKAAYLKTSTANN
jgi:hypothetical protein